MPGCSVTVHATGASRVASATPHLSLLPEPSLPVKRASLVLALLFALPATVSAQDPCGLLGHPNLNHAAIRFGTAPISIDPPTVEDDSTDTADIVEPDVWLAETGLSYSRILPSPLSNDSTGLALLSVRASFGREDHREQADGRADAGFNRLGVSYSIETEVMPNISMCGTTGFDLSFYSGEIMPEHHLSIPVSLAVAYTLKPSNGVAVSPFVQPTFAFFRQVARSTDEDGDIVRDTDAGRDFQLAAGLALRLSHVILTGAYRMNDEAIGGASQILISAGVAF